MSPDYTSALIGAIVGSTATYIGTHILYKLQKRTEKAKDVIKITYELSNDFEELIKLRKYRGNGPESEHYDVHLAILKHARQIKNLLNSMCIFNKKLNPHKAN